MQSGLSRQLIDKDIGIPVIRSNNLINGKIDFSDIKYWYKDDNKGAKTENYFLKENDLLVNFINSLSQIGKSALYKNSIKRDTIFTTNIMRLNFNKNINNFFIYSYFQLKKYENYIYSIAKPAVNQASFTTVDFKRFKMNVPSLAEQETIANFLSKVDKKINLFEENIKLWETYKKGIMRQLFAQKLRFKNAKGENYP
ncbi:restriction endonuclease subunit S, partial [Methanobrevibacter sp.]|uniref:restriction endonuclease subunit S n=1 Tax=Methanobrevibacter sp. TaxID=66852 RepID=UPI0026019B69